MVVFLFLFLWRMHNCALLAHAASTLQQGVGRIFFEMFLADLLVVQCMALVWPMFTFKFSTIIILSLFCLQFTINRVYTSLFSWHHFESESNETNYIFKFADLNHLMIGKAMFRAIICALWQFTFQMNSFDVSIIWIYGSNDLS